MELGNQILEAGFLALAFRNGEFGDWNIMHFLFIQKERK